MVATRGPCCLCVCAARGLSLTVVSILGEERVMEALRALVDTCMAAGMMREASTILKYVIKR